MGRLAILLLLLVVASVLVSDLRALLRVGPLRDCAWGADFVIGVGLIQLVNVVHIHLVEHLRILTVLWLVLVQIHGGQLLVELGLCLFLFLLSLGLLLFLLLISFLLGLNGPEFVKNILVVQNGVRELVLEIILVQKLADSISDNWGF